MDVTLDLTVGDRGNVGVKRVMETIPKLGLNDELTIVVDSADSPQINGIMEELRQWGFDYHPKGSDDGSTYHITAKRREFL